MRRGVSYDDCNWIIGHLIEVNWIRAKRLMFIVWLLLLLLLLSISLLTPLSITLHLPFWRLFSIHSLLLFHICYEKICCITSSVCQYLLWIENVGFFRLALINPKNVWLHCAPFEFTHKHRVDSTPDSIYKRRKFLDLQTKNMGNIFDFSVLLNCNSLSD